jgi:hypothetical protein
MSMATRLHTEITIDATPERVWDILTDFAAYPEWNPFVRRIAGEPVAGSRIEVHLQPPGSRGTTMRPTILAVEPRRELRWLGRLGLPGLFDGEHRFRIEADATSRDRVRFVQEERFTGVFAPIIMRFIGGSTRQGFEAMNRALKSRAEHIPATIA